MKNPGDLRGAETGLEQSESVQKRLYPTSTCFGCGPANPKGLQIRSFETSTGVVAHFQPEPHHDNGMGTLNGGIIATLLDCHSGAAVFVRSSHVFAGAFKPWVTAGLEIRYRLPTYLDEVCELSAAISEGEEDSMMVRAELSSGGKIRVQATSRWVRVSSPVKGSATP